MHISFLRIRYIIFHLTLMFSSRRPPNCIHLNNAGLFRFFESLVISVPAFHGRIIPLNFI